MATGWLLMILLAAGSPAFGVTYVFDGTYSLTSGTDLLGLDGTPFRQEVTPGSEVSTNLNNTNFAAGDRLITLSGTTDDGTYAFATSLQINWVTNGTNDSLTIGGSNYTIAGGTLSVDRISVGLGDFYPGSGTPVPLPEFAPSDVTVVSQAGDVTYSRGESLFGNYVITDLTANVLTGVPEPSSFALAVFGLLSLGIGNQRRRRR